MSNPYSIGHIFARMELDLIASMKRNLARHEAEEEEMGFKWEQWQQRKLQALNKYREANAKLLAKHGSEVDRLTAEMLKGDFTQGAGRVDRLVQRYRSHLKHLFDIGELTEPITLVDGTDESFFRINERRLNSLVEAATGELRAARHAMLRMADDVYRQTIYKSQVYLNSGAATLNKAIDMATKDFLDAGYDCITFKDGRRINIRSYAEMTMRASSQRAVFAGEGARREEWGIKTVIVSAHNNCSPLCLPWQGKPFIDDVYSGGQSGDKGGMTLLSTAMRGGLFHPNCRHNMSTYIPGISSLPEPVDDAEALGNYRAEQQQRYMERQVRRYKRREAGSADKDNRLYAAGKVKEWEGKIKTHMAQNEFLRRDKSREKVPGEMSAKERNELLKKVEKESGSG